ncbi:MAG TPA: hypothetical protein VI039_11540 [Solirubrobacterales bacterium]
MPRPQGFQFEQRGEEVAISHHGRRATSLRGAAARRLAWRLVGSGPPL